jgi:hypothetical protein
VVLQLEVDFSPVYDREPHPDLDLEKRIEMTWEQRVAKQPSLYNGTKFRYGGYNRAKAGEGMTVSSETVCLHLGLTDYKYVSHTYSFGPFGFYILWKPFELYV